MDPKTPAVERLIDALSPTIAAELERVVSETRKTLENDFEQRLKDAIQNAESSTRNQAEADRKAAVERAVQEARDAIRKQVTDELQLQFNKTMDDTSTNLKTSYQAELQKAQVDLKKAQSDLQKLQTDWNSDRVALEHQVQQWRSLAEAQRQLADAGSQTEILVRWLKLAEPFGSSIAVYTAKADGLALWKNRGKAVFPEIISQQTTDPETYFKPIVVRGKTLAAVCASQPYSSDALDYLAVTVERTIELFALKLRTPAIRPGIPEPARIS